MKYDLLTGFKTPLHCAQVQAQISPFGLRYFPFPAGKELMVLS